MADTMKKAWKQFHLGAMVMNCCMLALGLLMAGLYIIVGGIQNFYLIYCISKAVKAVRNNKIVDVEWNVVG